MDGTCTCLWSRKHEEHLTRVTQFDKTQHNIKQHMCKVFHGIWHMALVGLAYHWETCLFELFKNKNSRFQASLEQGCITLFTIYILTTT